MTAADGREDCMNVAASKSSVIALSRAESTSKTIQPRRIAMAENVPKAVTPAALTPFGGDFDQIFNRMLRGWPFGWLEPMVHAQPRALRAFDHAPKVDGQENGRRYTDRGELPGHVQKEVTVLGEDDMLTISR